jgi:hypothetical protein
MTDDEWRVETNISLPWIRDMLLQGPSTLFSLLFFSYLSFITWAAGERTGVGVIQPTFTFRLMDLQGRGKKNAIE